MSKKINLIQKLKNFAPDWIVLAGFLLKVPSNLIDAYPNRIIKFGNIISHSINVMKAISISRFVSSVDNHRWM